MVGTPLPYNPKVPSTQHTLTVLAVDEAGNKESAVRAISAKDPSLSYNQYTWSIDTRKPVAKFVGSPQRPPTYVCLLPCALHPLSFARYPFGRARCARDPVAMRARSPCSTRAPQCCRRART